MREETVREERQREKRDNERAVEGANESACFLTADNAISRGFLSPANRIFLSNYIFVIMLALH